MQTEACSESSLSRYATWRIRLRRFITPVIMLLGLALCLWGLWELLDQASLSIQITPFQITLAIASGMLSLVLGAIAWAAFLHAFVGERIGFADSLAQNGLVLIGKYVPGKVAGVAARILANASLSASLVIAATIVETMGAVAAAFGVGAMLWAAPAGWPLLFPIMGIGMIAWWASPACLSWAFSLVGRVSKRARNWLSADGMAARPAILRSALLCQVFQWGALALLVIAVTSMVLPELSTGILMQAAGGYAVAVGCGALLFVFPGGFGPREGIFVWLMHDALGMEQALAVVLLLRIATTLIDLGGGACWLVLQIARHVSATTTSQ